MNTREVGDSYEKLAENYLVQHGVKICEKNFRNRKGEIDIIGRDEEYLVFFEVKYRKNAQKGLPVEAVTKAKQRTICRVADYYRMIRGIGEFSAIRYDVVAICDDEIMWYKNAFPHVYQ